MGSKICSILGLLSIPVVLPGWNRASQKQLSRFEKARKSQKLRGVKTRAMWQQQGTYARPWKTSELEKLHSRHTQRSCVTESRDSPAESALPTSFYMGDVDDFEEDIEEPAKYVPPPTLDVEDAKIISITENVLYALKRFLCGLVGKHDTDWKNCDTVLKVVSKTVEFQDPVICFRGLKSLIWWLESLSAAPISMDVNEIYSENQATNFSKPQIHIVWTVVFTDYQERSSMQDSWRGNYMALLQDLHNLKESINNSS
eukprot:Gb_19529 [translate_table: standard]